MIELTFEGVLYPLLAVLLVSFVSILAALPLLLKKKLSKKVLLFLLSMSVGVLLATVFLDFVPEMYSHALELSAEVAHAGEVELLDAAALSAEAEHGHQSMIWLSLIVIVGFVTMFLFEKFIHYHHSKRCEDHDCGHSHAYTVAPVNLIGDGLHNFIDGLVIAGSFAVSTTIGIAATIAVLFHEIPQEIADFGVLLFSGLSKKKALLYNLLSALTAVIGAIFGILLAGSIESFSMFILPFAAGNFIYIAASNLVPQLHRECDTKDTLLHVFAMLLGVAIILLLTIYGPAHSHA